MSDWKKRATLVVDETPTQESAKTGSWKDRAVPVETAPSMKSEALETAYDTLAGTAQGSMMGFADESGGGLQALLDGGQSVLHNIGLADESPTQVGARLKAEGFTGKIGPTSAARS